MAPYGVDKDQGGDSKENDSWMEKCVTKVQEGGKSKPSAIAICKAQLKKSKEKDSSLEFESVEIEVMSQYNSFREQWIRKEMQKGFTLEQSKSHFDIYLSLNNYSFI
jgi:hypothetical protein